MNNKSLPILLLLVAVLGGAAWWLTREDPNKEPPLKSDVLLAELGGPPDEIRLFGPDRRYYKLERTARGWLITDPIKDEASAGQVDAIIKYLQAARKQIAWPDGKETPKRVEDAGLKEPKGKVVVAREGREVTIELGNESFPPNTCFARINGEVFKIPLGLEAAVAINRDDLINPYLFLTSPSGLRELTIRREGGEAGVYVRRKGDGTFAVRSGPKAAERPADALAMTKLIAQLLSSRARRFMPKGELSEFPKRWLRIELVGDYGKETVELSDPNTGLVFALKKYPDGERKTRMEVDSNRFEAIVGSSIDGLISSQLWTFGASTASKIHVETRAGKTPYVLERFVDEQQNPAHRLIQPERRGGDQETVNSWIIAAESTTVVRFLGKDDADLAEAQRALAKPELSIRLESPEARRLAAFSIRLARGAGGKIWAQRNDDGQPIEVASPKFDDMLVPWWQHAELVAFRYAGNRPVRRLVIEHGGQTTAAELSEQRWLVDGKDDQETHERFEELFAEMRTVPANKLLGLAKGVAELEAKPWARISVLSSLASEEPKPIGTLELWSVARGALYARRVGDLLAFRIGGRTARTLRRLVTAKE